MDKDVIYKYGPFETLTSVVEYAGEIVHVGMQDGEIYIWCRLSNGSKGGKARIVATGEHFIGAYHGTVISQSGLVWHVVGQGDW